MDEQLSHADFVNEIAVEVNDALGAGATVVMSVVIGDDGKPMALIGSTGVSNAVHLLAATLPEIADALRSASEGRDDVRRTLFLRTDNPN